MVICIYVGTPNYSFRLENEIANSHKVCLSKIADKCPSAIIRFTFARENKQDHKNPLQESPFV